MLGNRWMEDEADGGEEKVASLIAGSARSSPVVTSLLFSPAASVGFSSVVAGAAGTKNFAPTNGFADPTAGDR